MLLELNKEQLGVLRRALEARVRDMHLRLGSDPGDEGFRREATLATQLLRQVEALERQICSLCGLVRLLHRSKPFAGQSLTRTPLLSPDVLAHTAKFPSQRVAYHRMNAKLRRTS